jgi:polyisoprenoid-binding protein YceI
MKKAVIAAAVLGASLWAGSLSFESGAIRAHTEVFGDSSIDPMFKKAQSRLVMDADPASLRGTIEVNIADFVSDNTKRDASMYETMESARFPKASFDIKEVVPKGGSIYLLRGTMNLHGVSRGMNFEGSIVEEEGKVRIKAKSVMKMTDFGIKPPKMVFLTVRDQVDLSVDVVLKR